MIVFISFQKEAGKGAEFIHKAALRRLRHYANLKDPERACLVDLLCKLKLNELGCSRCCCY
jgi:hypothetical protein